MDLGTLLNSSLKLGGSSRTLTFSIDGRTIQAMVPGDSVFFGVKDILFNREYELFSSFDLPHSRRVVVDAGANVGLYAMIASLWADHVVALEPDSQIFKTLSDNVSRNHLRNIVLRQTALAKSTESVGFYRRGNTQLGSIRTRKYVEPVLVDAISLEGLLEEIDNRIGAPVDLLKLDIEGSEFDVILNSDLESFRQIDKIVAEIHTEHGDVSSLTRKLRECGYRYVITKRPILKNQDDRILVLSDYRLKLFLKAVDLIMGVSHYSDWSSLMLFASRNQADLPPAEVATFGSQVVEASLS